MRARWRATLVCVGLFAAVSAVYGRVVGHEFLAYDTQLYVTENPWVLRGLTWEGLRWAFDGFHAANWHPLAWISHMIDVEVFGLRPGLHHLVNVTLHAINACLVLFVLRRLTGAFEPSLFAAALFALHPLHVESVAWIVERKDVLSAFFGLLGLLAWTGWARQRSRRDYAAALVAFAAALMSKPMLVTWPCVLLLLDVWPLERARLGARALVIEKIPFLVLSAASCAITLASQRSFGAVTRFEHLPFSDRLSNAITAYAGYLGKTVWPASLVFHYPHPGAAIETSHVALALVVLAAASALAWSFRRRAPWLIVGWLFYSGTLVPVIGLVQVGRQAMADRYTYLPLLGVFVAVAWSAAAVLRVHPSARVWARTLAAAVCATLGIAAWRQTGHWKDLETLARHALAVDARNPVALDMLGVAYVERGELDEAERAFREALAIAPDDIDALVNLTNLQNRRGRHAEAEDTARRALRHAPMRADALRGLATALWGEGRREDALGELARVLRRDPDDEAALLIRGQVLSEVGRPHEALASLERAVAISPSDAEARLALARHFALQGDRARSAREHEAARVELERALERSERDAAAHGMLGLVYFERGDLAAAEPHLRRAIALDAANVEALANLASLLQHTGRRAEALETLDAATRLAPAREDLRRHLALLKDAQGR